MPDWIRYLESRLPLNGLGAADRLRVIEELAQEMEQAYEDALRAGESAGSAEARALQTIGDVDELSRLIVQSRRSNRVPAADLLIEGVEDSLRNRRPDGSRTADLAQSLRFTLQIFRRLVRTPSFTILTILTLALGIGANTAVFTAIERVILEPLPYEDPSKLIQIWFEVPGQDVDQLNQSSGTYMTTRSEQQTLVDIGLWNSSFVNVRDPAGTERVDAMQVSDGTLPLLGVNPVVGRLFTAGDDSPDAPGTAVLSWGYWKRKFSGDETAIGQMFEVHGEIREIIGVLPRGFRFLDLAPDLYLPFRLDPARATMSDFSLRAIARMRTG
ncbi:ABC transporter permease, partial [Gemmatimonadota bacterium]